MISFTFDDFPRSALTIAGEMLMARGWRGTYYGSMGLLGKVTALGPMFTREDLDTLLAAGHELACHTLDHASCLELDTAEVSDACAANRRQAAAWLDGYQLRNMSFPYGHVTLAAKHSLQSAYDTCRSIESGINVDPVDRGFLRANPVYSHLEGDPLKQLIEANTQANGWLILYTHDVATDPSSYGCTPLYFEKVLRYAAESGAEVLPICQAAARYLIAPSAGHETRAEILPSSRL